MRTITTYQCEGCGKKFSELSEAIRHESRCYDIPFEDMRSWACALNDIHTDTRDWDMIERADAYLDYFYEKYKTSRDKMPYYYGPYVNYRYD